MALLLAAGLMYLPANIYPIATIPIDLTPTSYTVLGGVIDLVRSHLLGLAALVFTASFTIPLLKMLGLAWCASSAMCGSCRFLIGKTRVFRIVEEIGRWSMVDPLTIACFVPVLQFNALIDGHVASRRSCLFRCLVILTTLAVQFFDPRKMWDVAEQNPMSTPEDQGYSMGDVPLASRRRTVWPNLIWGIPLAALLIVGYLGVKALFNRGEVVTVTFNRAAGAKPGMTKVLYQGIEAGQLIKIEPNADGRRLDFLLRLVPAAKIGLNTNARFWLIGANPNFSDLSSLKAVVSGIAIGYAPGDGGDPTDRFEGLDQAPLILPSDKGTRYELRAHSLNSIHEGSIILFHGQAIGKIIELQFDGNHSISLTGVHYPAVRLARPSGCALLESKSAAAVVHQRRHHRKLGAPEYAAGRRHRPGSGHHQSQGSSKPAGHRVQSVLLAQCGAAGTIGPDGTL